jgi:hypothetical protein
MYEKLFRVLREYSIDHDLDFDIIDNKTINFSDEFDNQFGIEINGRLDSMHNISGNKYKGLGTVSLKIIKSESTDPSIVDMFMSHIQEKFSEIIKNTQ